MSRDNTLKFGTFEKQQNMTFADFITRHLDDIIVPAFGVTGAQIFLVSGTHPFLAIMTFTFGGVITWLLYTAGSAFVGWAVKKGMDKSLEIGEALVIKARAHYRNRKKKK